MTIRVTYAPIVVDDACLYYMSNYEVPEDGYGAGYKHPPELNKIYDPKRPRYPGWWVHMYVETMDEVDAAFKTIQDYLLTTYELKVERKVNTNIP